MATKLIDLIEKVNADDLPTNEFTIEDKDPMVILGKLNDVIAYLEQLQATINSSDTKANEALQKAIQAVADATQALSVANGIDDKATQALANAVEAVSTANSALNASNTALSTANTAISTANTALSSANSAVETAGDALGTAESAETKADTAISTANGAKTTAEGIDTKATQALANSQTALSTANTANDKATSADTKADTAITTANTANTNASNAVSTANSASSTASTASQNASTALTTAQTANQNASTALTTANNADSKADSAVATAEDALSQVVAGQGTKLYRGSQLLSSLDIKPIEVNIADNTTDITSLQNGKVDKVTGKQLSTEDFTTAEKNKLAGLNNYDDTQVQADIIALQNAISALGIKYKDLGSGGNCRQRYLICVGGMGIWAGYTNDWNDASSITISYGVTFLSSPYPTATFTGGGQAQYYDGKWIRNITATGFNMWNACNSGTGAFVIAMGPIDASTIS